jgi:hypothetical protein
MASRTQRLRASRIERLCRLSHLFRERGVLPGSSTSAYTLSRVGRRLIQITGSVENAKSARKRGAMWRKLRRI